MGKSQKDGKNFTVYVYDAAIASTFLTIFNSDSARGGQRYCFRYGARETRGAGEALSTGIRRRERLMKLT